MPERRTIHECPNCREVISAPEVEPEEGLFICPSCETVLNESDWVPAADYDRVVEAVKNWNRAHYHAANRDAAGMGTYDHATRDALDAELLRTLGLGLAALPEPAPGEWETRDSGEGEPPYSVERGSRAEGNLEVYANRILSYEDAETLAREANLEPAPGDE